MDGRQYFRHNSNSLSSYFDSYFWFDYYSPNDALIVANNEFYVPDKSSLTYTVFEFYGNDNLHFINNTILNNKSSDAYFYMNYCGGKSVFKNNQLVNLNGGEIMDVNGMSFTESDYNNIYAATSLADWQTITGLDSHSVSIQPYFINPILI
jgi:hypothetical protein